VKRDEYWSEVLVTMWDSTKGCHAPFILLAHTNCVQMVILGC
jgi:hypothetical protein